MDLLEILSYSLLDYFPCVKSLKNIHLYSNYVALIYLLWQITQIGVWRRFRKTTAGRNTGQLEAEIPNLGQQLKSKKNKLWIVRKPNDVNQGLQYLLPSLDAGIHWNLC